MDLLKEGKFDFPQSVCFRYFAKVGVYKVNQSAVLKMFLMRWEVVQHTSFVKGRHWSSAMRPMRCGVMCSARAMARVRDAHAVFALCSLWRASISKCGTFCYHHIFAVLIAIITTRESLDLLSEWWVTSRTLFISWTTSLDRLLFFVISLIGSNVGRSRNRHPCNGSATNTLLFN